MSNNFMDKLKYGHFSLPFDGGLMDDSFLSTSLLSALEEVAEAYFDTHLTNDEFMDIAARTIQQFITNNNLSEEELYNISRFVDIDGKEICIMDMFFDFLFQFPFKGDIEEDAQVYGRYASEEGVFNLLSSAMEAPSSKDNILGMLKQIKSLSTGPSSEVVTEQEKKDINVFAEKWGDAFSKNNDFWGLATVKLNDGTYGYVVIDPQTIKTKLKASGVDGLQRSKNVLNYLKEGISNWGSLEDIKVFKTKESALAGQAKLLASNTPKGAEGDANTPNEGAAPSVELPDSTSNRSLKELKKIMKNNKELLKGDGKKGGDSGPITDETSRLDLQFLDKAYSTLGNEALKKDFINKHLPKKITNTGIKLFLANYMYEKTYNTPFSGPFMSSIQFCIKKQDYKGNDPICLEAIKLLTLMNTIQDFGRLEAAGVKNCDFSKNPVQMLVIKVVLHDQIDLVKFEEDERTVEWNFTANEYTNLEDAPKIPYKNVEWKGVDAMLGEWKKYKGTGTYAAKQAQRFNSEHSTGSTKLSDKQIQNILNKYNLSFTPATINALVQQYKKENWTPDYVLDKLKERGITNVPSTMPIEDLYLLYAVATNTGATNWTDLIKDVQNVDTASLSGGK
jgi:hypothetical protein